MFMAVFGDYCESRGVIDFVYPTFSEVLLLFFAAVEQGRQGCPCSFLRLIPAFWVFSFCDF